jgi:hypothetical protein
MKYHVVGCPHCNNHWVIGHVGYHNTTSCPRCERRYRRPEKATPDNFKQLKSLATADSKPDAAAMRASVLSQKASSVDGARTFGLEDVSTFSEMDDLVDGAEMVTEAANARLEAETDLDAAELEDNVTLRRDPDVDVLRRPGQPDIDLGVTPRAQSELVQEALVEASIQADDAFVGEASMLEREGLDPEYLEQRAQEVIDEDVDDAFDSANRPDGQSLSGLRLTHRDDLPATADVVLDEVGPRMREWLGEWTQKMLPATAETALDLVREHDPGAVQSKRLSRELKSTLQTEYGITAMDGIYAETLAEYAVAYVSGTTFGTFAANEGFDREERLRNTILDVGTPGSTEYNGLDDFVRGSVRVHAFDEEPQTTIVHLDADAWLTLDDRATGLRALRTLGAIAESSRVYLSHDSLLLLEELDDRYGDYLAMAGVDLTEARDAALRQCDVETPEVSAPDAERVYNWVCDVRDDTQEVRVVKALARAPDTALTRDELLANPDVDISQNSLYAVKDRLVSAGLVAWRSRRGRDQSSRLVLTAAGELASVYIDADYSLRDPLRAEVSTRLTAHHIADAGAVGSRGARSGGGRGSLRDAATGSAPLATATTAEDWLAAASAAGFAQEDDPQYVHWLQGPGGPLGSYAMHRRHTAPATTPGVHLVDERIDEWNGRDDLSVGDGRSTFISDLEVRDGEFAIIAQVSLDPLVTLGRIANALLDNRVTSNVLTEGEVGREFEGLYDGAWQDLEDVDSIEGVHDLLRDAVQIGWKSSDERTVAEFRERFGALRARLNERVGECVGLEPGEEERVELLRDLHGAVASMTQLLFASGRDVVVNLRVPQTYELLTDELYRRDFLSFFEAVVPKQAVYRSPTGWHSWTRQTQEERPEKLNWRKSPGIEDDYPTADLTASWVVTGPTVTDLLDDVRRAVDAGVRERSDGKLAPPALEVPVRDATRPQVIAEVVEELAGENDYAVANSAVSEFNDVDYNPDEVAVDADRADDITRLLRVFCASLGTEDRPLTASPHAVAEALLHINSSDRRNDYLRVRDVEYGLANLPPEQFLPTLGPVATSIVQELLLADEPLLPSEAVERSISSSSTNRVWEENREELLALGIVEERATGRNEHYIATLEPWWSPSTSASRPPNVPDSMVTSDHEHQMLYEISVALGLDVDDDLFTWIDEKPSTDTIYDSSDRLRRWRPMLEAAFAGREDLLDVPPPQRAREVVVLGRFPDRSQEPWYARDEPRESLSHPHYSPGETGAKSTYGD